MKATRLAQVLVLAALAVSLGGCAFGVTKVNVTHSPLQPVEKRQGTLVVRPFVDNRKEDRQYIGTKRNGFGMPLGNIGVRDGQPADQLLTGFFVEALRHAGYDAVLETAPSGAPTAGLKNGPVLEGEIRKFWLDLYMATWDEVEVHLRLLAGSGGQVQWEKDIQGKKTNVLWLGLGSEFETVIREALDEALNRAVQEFASEEFYQKVTAHQGGP